MGKDKQVISKVVSLYQYYILGISAYLSIIICAVIYFVAALLLVLPALLSYANNSGIALLLYLVILPALGILFKDIRK